VTAYRTPARVTPDPSREAADYDRPLIYRGPQATCPYCRCIKSMEHIGVCLAAPQRKFFARAMRRIKDCR